ncbi:bacillithiol system redox-active protein YtxJ [Algivirga pacifica]|uniref:Bacillithiol system redox-active protein YtxJ n=1 Tax=Algivirga pacifica TaxID=1162670 RepID=A0ABP9DNY5_9BACT
MDWNSLTSVEQLQEIKEISKNEKVLIFKHSTRCSISAMALNRLERAWKEETPIKPYLLDLISYRDVSNQVAQEFAVDHQSPQVLVIENGICVYDTSHMGISYNAVVAAH